MSVAWFNDKNHFLSTRSFVRSRTSLLDIHSMNKFQSCPSIPLLSHMSTMTMLNNSNRSSEIADVSSLSRSGDAFLTEDIIGYCLTMDVIIVLLWPCALEKANCFVILIVVDNEKKFCLVHWPSLRQSMRCPCFLPLTLSLSRVPVRWRATNIIQPISVSRGRRRRRRWRWRSLDTFSSGKRKSERIERSAKEGLDVIGMNREIRRDRQKHQYCIKSANYMACFWPMPIHP